MKRCNISIIRKKQHVKYTFKTLFQDIISHNSVNIQYSFFKLNVTKSNSKTNGHNLRCFNIKHKHYTLFLISRKKLSRFDFFENFQLILRLKIFLHSLKIQLLVSCIVLIHSLAKSCD